MTVGLAIIARDEQESLPHLLASIEGAFDRVVLLDTGSEDDTVNTFLEWTCEQTNITYSVGRFEWTDDFSVARQASYNLLLHGTTVLDPTCAWPSVKPMVDWTCWADCDDILHNASAIRGLCDSAPEHVAAFLCGYAYGFTEPECQGTCVSYLWRERMVRAGQGRWQFRVHEAQDITGGMVAPVNPAELEWRHRKFNIVEEGQAANSNTRNLAILEQWAADEPDNSRVLGYCAIESMLNGKFDQSLNYFDRYFASSPEWDDERAQAHRRHAMCLMQFERFDDVIATALAAVAVKPSWADSYMSLAEAYIAKGDGEKAVYWAKHAIEVGAPQRTLMVVNPTDYTFLPRKLLAAAVSLQGDYAQALALAKEALEIVPEPGLAMVARDWQRRVKRQHTRDTVQLMAEQLIAHDEQLKALALLEDCVPHFVEDDPGLVALRSALRERLSWIGSPEAFEDHYATGGSKPEDFEATATVEQIDKLCEYLPRTNFLLNGLREQAGIE